MFLSQAACHSEYPRVERKDVQGEERAWETYIQESIAVFVLLQKKQRIGRSGNVRLGTVVDESVEALKRSIESQKAASGEKL